MSEGKCNIPQNLDLPSLFFTNVIFQRNFGDNVLSEVQSRCFYEVKSKISLSWGITWRILYNLYPHYFSHYPQNFPAHQNSNFCQQHYPQFSLTKNKEPCSMCWIIRIAKFGLLPSFWYTSCTFWPTLHLPSFLNYIHLPYSGISSWDLQRVKSYPHFSSQGPKSAKSVMSDLTWTCPKCDFWLIFAYFSILTPKNGPKSRN